MTENKADIEPDRQVRRKLLRGSFAAPAVLTVYSGGAAATSVGSCLVKANNNPITGDSITVTGADDQLLRYQLWMVTGPGSSGVKSYWIKGADLSPFVRNSQQPFLSSSQYQQFDIANNVLVSNTITTTQPGSTNSTFTPSMKYVVLRIDKTGAVVGAGATGTGAPVGDSCWNSFALATH